VINHSLVAEFSNVAESVPLPVIENGPVADQSNTFSVAALTGAAATKHRPANAAAISKKLHLAADVLGAAGLNGGTFRSEKSFPNCNVGF
jgi:hypothetical protein